MFAEHTIHESEEKSSGTGDEDPEERTLVRPGREYHRSEETGGETDPTDDQCRLQRTTSGEAPALTEYAVPQHDYA